MLKKTVIQIWKSRKIVRTCATITLIVISGRVLKPNSVLAFNLADQFVPSEAESSLWIARNFTVSLVEGGVIVVDVRTIIKGATSCLEGVQTGDLRKCILGGLSCTFGTIGAGCVAGATVLGTEGWSKSAALCSNVGHLCTAASYSLAYCVD